MLVMARCLPVVRLISYIADHLSMAEIKTGRLCRCAKMPCSQINDETALNYCATSANKDMTGRMIEIS